MFVWTLFLAICTDQGIEDENISFPAGPSHKMARWLDVLASIAYLEFSFWKPSLPAKAGDVLFFFVPMLFLLAKDVIPEIEEETILQVVRGENFLLTSCCVSFGGFQNFAIGHERLEGSRSRTWFGTSGGLQASRGLGCGVGMLLTWKGDFISNSQLHAFWKKLSL